MLNKSATYSNTKLPLMTFQKRLLDLFLVYKLKYHQCMSRSEPDSLKELHLLQSLYVTFYNLCIRWKEMITWLSIKQILQIEQKRLLFQLGKYFIRSMIKISIKTNCKFNEFHRSFQAPDDHQRLTSLGGGIFLIKIECRTSDGIQNKNHFGFKRTTALAWQIALSSWVWRSYTTNTKEIILNTL